MEYLNVLKELPGNFMKCGIAGWCLEVMFTSVESVLARDWRLMGRTSLLMFPIYGCGAFLSPALKLIDFWIGDQKVSLPEQLIRHGMIDMVLIFTAEYISGAWLRARGMCPWDYSASRASVNGLIRLDLRLCGLPQDCCLNKLQKREANDLFLLLFFYILEK